MVSEWSSYDQEIKDMAKDVEVGEAKRQPGADEGATAAEL